MEQHIHNLDVCNWVIGTTPASAQGTGGRQVRTESRFGNIFDHHAVEFTYPDGTVMQSDCRQIPGCVNEVREVIVGTEGIAELSAVSCQITKAGQLIWETKRASKADRANPYRAEHVDLWAAIENDLAYNEAATGADATLTAILGRLASYSGKRISWDEASASERVLTTDAEDWQATAPVQPRPDGSYEILIPGVTRVL